MGAQEAHDVVDQRRVGQAARRQVHGDAQVQTRRVPGRALADGGLQDVQRERAHEAGVLGDGDELVGGIGPRIGWYQRTRASTPTTRPSARAAFGW